MINLKFAVSPFLLTASSLMAASFQQWVHVQRLHKGVGQQVVVT